MGAASLDIQEQPIGNVIADWNQVMRKPETTAKAMCNPEILLIDDDYTFCRAFSRLARKYFIPVTTFPSFEDFDITSSWRYDVVLMDYDLGNINGIEFASYLQQTIGEIPVVIVSQTQRKETASEPWPSVVKMFTDKSKGLEGILDDAIRVFVQD